MDIATLLPERLLHPFRAVCGSLHAIQVARGLDALNALMRVHHHDILVVDPQLVGPHHLAALGAALDRVRATVHVVVYTTVNAESVRACHRLGTRGYRHVVLYGIDDEPSQFRALLEAVPADALVDQLLKLLRDRLDRLEPALADALEAVFRSPPSTSTVEQLAARAGMPRRTLYDALERAGLATPAQLLEAARVLRAYHYLRVSGARVRDVAIKLGYPTPDALASDTRSATGFLPSSLARELESDDLVSRLAAVARSPRYRSSATMGAPGRD